MMTADQTAALFKKNLSCEQAQENLLGLPPTFICADASTVADSFPWNQIRSVHCPGLAMI